MSGATLAQALALLALQRAIYMQPIGNGYSRQQLMVPIVHIIDDDIDDDESIRMSSTASSDPSDC
jgi:hypothetical protein